MLSMPVARAFAAVISALIVAITPMSGARASGARVVKWTVQGDAFASLTGSAEDDGKQPAAVVIEYLAKFPMSASRDLDRDARDAKKATLTGKIAVDLSSYGRIELDSLELRFWDTEHKDDAKTPIYNWVVAPEEIPRLAKLIQTLPAPLTVPELAAKVKAAERLYRNIDLVMRREFDSGPSPVPIPRARPSGRNHWDMHFVTQDNLWRLDRKGDAFAEVVAFDGAFLRDSDRKKYFIMRRILTSPGGNVTNRPPEWFTCCGPHDLFQPHPSVLVPLGSLLEANNTALEHAAGPLNVRCEETAIVEGLSCQNVVVEIQWGSRAPRSLASRTRLSLAVDHNFIPVRIRSARFPKYSRPHADTPERVSTVKRWSEIKPGLWSPAEIVIQDRLATTRYWFDKVGVDPNYPRTYFTDIKPLDEGLSESAQR
jgi:hypothetical protein